MFPKHSSLPKVAPMTTFNMYMTAATKTKNLYLCNPRDIVGLRIAAISSCVVTMTNFVKIIQNPV